MIHINILLLNQHKMVVFDKSSMTVENNQNISQIYIKKQLFSDIYIHLLGFSMVEIKSFR